MVARIIGGKAGLVFEINTPLTAALLYEQLYTLIFLLSILLSFSERKDNYGF